MKKYPSVALLFVLLFCAVTGAQGKEGAASEIDVSFYALAFAKGHESIYLSTPKGEMSPVTLSTATITEAYKTTLDADFKVTLRGKDNDTYPIIAEATVGQEVQQPLLILVPSEGDMLYRVVVIDHSIDSLPEGSYILINLSEMDIRGHIGSVEVSVAAESVSPILSVHGEADSLDIHFEYKLPQCWKTFARTSWSKESDKRSLLMAYLDPRTKRMKIKGVEVKSLD